MCTVFENTAIILWTDSLKREQAIQAGNHGTSGWPAVCQKSYISFLQRLHNITEKNNVLLRNFDFSTNHPPPDRILRGTGDQKITWHIRWFHMTIWKTACRQCLKKKRPLKGDTYKMSLLAAIVMHCIYTITNQHRQVKGLAPQRLLIGLVIFWPEFMMTDPWHFRPKVSANQVALRGRMNS